MYEVTFIDTGRTERWSLRKCEKVFGAAEFREILQGYLPHIVAVEL